MDMGDETEKGHTAKEYQEPLPGILGNTDKNKTPESITPSDDPSIQQTPGKKPHTNYVIPEPEESNYPCAGYGKTLTEEIENMEVLNRKDSSVIEFTQEAREYLYSYLEKQALGRNKLDAFRFKTGELQDFVDTNQAWPSGEKRTDPYYTHPKKYKRGIAEYTEEIINSGDGYFWLVTKKQIGSYSTKWSVSKIENPQHT